MKRRQLIHAGLAGGGLLALGGCAGLGALPRHARVVVVGGGYGGATAAKYVRLLSDRRIDVVLIEPNARFVSCPISNLVVGGVKSIDEITSPYDRLGSAHGVR
ncbi:MAG TPA: flavocytochrome C, partial [Methylibium sp.]|nr:flavocytochrome C [Methylibium sp.]